MHNEEVVSVRLLMEFDIQRQFSDFQTGSEVHPSSYSVGMEDSFPGDKTAGA